MTVDLADLGTPPAGTIPPAPVAPVTPPWGNDFDAARAWTLVENLRADKERLSARPVLTPEQAANLEAYNDLLEASKDDLTRQTEAAERYRSEAQTASTRLAAYETAREHGIPLEHVDFLGSGTPEEIAAKAVRLKAILAGQAPATPPAIPAPGGRTISQLQPGASPQGEVDPEAADYAALFGADAK